MAASDPGDPSAPASSSPPQWPRADAPGGRVLGFDLHGLDEDKLLGDGGRAALYALSAGAADYDPKREPLILVHGIEGNPDSLQSVVRRFIGATRYQLHVLCFDDYHRRTSENGDDFAGELGRLSARSGLDVVGGGGPITIVAHSMGGLVTRRALDRLAVGGGLAGFSRVRVIGIDNPWHGYVGPSDRGFQGLFMSVARPFLPDGLEDMRASSAMFQGDPKASDPVDRAGLFGVSLPDHVSIELVFAKDGDEVADYTEPLLAPLADAIVRKIHDEQPITGDARMVNFWRALLDSAQYGRLQGELRDLDDAGQLTANAVRGELLRLYPRFPGDHTTVLDEHPGVSSLLDFLVDRLAE